MKDVLPWKHVTRHGVISKGTSHKPRNRISSTKCEWVVGLWHNGFAAPQYFETSKGANDVSSVVSIQLCFCLFCLLFALVIIYTRSVRGVQNLGDICRSCARSEHQCVVGPWLVRAAGLKKKLAHKYVIYMCVRLFEIGLCRWVILICVFDLKIRFETWNANHAGAGLCRFAYAVVGTNSPSRAIMVHSAGFIRCTSAAPRTYGPHKPFSLRLGQKTDTYPNSAPFLWPGNIFVWCLLQISFHWPCCHEFNCIQTFCVHVPRFSLPSFVFAIWFLPKTFHDPKLSRMSEDFVQLCNLNIQHCCHVSVHEKGTRCDNSNGNATDAGLNNISWIG